MKQYLEWERQSAILPIVLCLEAWIEPTRKYFGKPWPDTYLKYEGNVVSWYTKMDGLHDFGQLIIDLHYNGMNEFLIQTKNLAKKIDAMRNELDIVNLIALSDPGLLEIYKNVCSLYTDWFVLGAVCEPVGIKGEYLVSKLVNHASNPDKALCLLTTTARKSFSKRELEELFAIAIKFKEGIAVDELLSSHSKKWFWLHNNYFKTEVLTTEYFKNELKTLLSKYPTPGEYLTEMELATKQMITEKNKLISELKLREKEKQLIEILDFHAWYQDYRKEYIMILLHYLDVVLREIATRKQLTLEDVKWLLREEVIGLFQGKNFNALIRERKKYAFFVWENDKFGSFAGEDARKKEKEILGHIKTSKEIIEIPGNIANKGKVRGIARVTMNSSEAKHLTKGEILVTSMTSPDFISAIKKAAAIVTNEGGILCHAAIVSREFGIPCIVGTGIATKSIKNGDLIEVDANHGFVRILKR
jgi:phosphohistidine swiveling domain-containing protein